MKNILLQSIFFCLLMSAPKAFSAEEKLYTITTVEYSVNNECFISTTSDLFVIDQQGNLQDKSFLTGNDLYELKDRKDYHAIEDCILLAERRKLLYFLIPDTRHTNGAHISSISFCQDTATLTKILQNNKDNKQNYQIFKITPVMYTNETLKKLDRTPTRKIVFFVFVCLAGCWLINKMIANVTIQRIYI